MLRKELAAFLCLLLCWIGLAGCSEQKAETPSPSVAGELEDGVYLAEFRSDSSMFHVNEVCDGKGILTVEKGEMTIHLTMPSKNIVNLFPGTAEEAKQEGASLLMPVLEEVTYDDGFTEEVYGFDLPVPALKEEFDCALLGKKGKWYDHKVSVSNPERQDDAPAAYAEVTLTGGTGRVSVESPSRLTRDEQGVWWAELVWSSPNYEYMLVNDVRYDSVLADGKSTFQIPVVLEEDMEVSAMTLAMSQPHLIDYVLHFEGAELP